MTNLLSNCTCCIKSTSIVEFPDERTCITVIGYYLNQSLSKTAMQKRKKNTSSQQQASKNQRYGEIKGDRYTSKAVTSVPLSQPLSFKENEYNGKSSITFAKGVNFCDFLIALEWGLHYKERMSFSQANSFFFRINILLPGPSSNCKLAYFLFFTS